MFFFRSTTSARIASVCFVVLMLGIVSCDSRDHPRADKSIMSDITKDMRPFCVGRFVVHIPTDAKIRIFSQSIQGFGEITVHPDIPKERFFAIAESKERKLRATPHRKEGTILKEAVTLDAAKILVYRDDDLNTLDFDLLGYFWKDSTGYEFAYGAENDRVEESKADLQRAVNLINARNNDDVPNKPGFCIDHAFVSNGEFRLESAGVAFTLPAYPRLEIGVSIDTIDSPSMDDDLITRGANNLPAVMELHPDMEVNSIRKGSRTIAGVEGQEIFERVDENKSGEFFKARWEFRGEPKSLTKPSIALDLSYSPRSSEETDQTSKNLTQDETLALWDRYVDSLRLRQD